MKRLTERDFKLGWDDSYRLPSYAAVYERLREYEDLEEQDKLLKLPVAVGDVVYHLCCHDIIKMKIGCIEPYGAIRIRKGIKSMWNIYAETDYTKEYFTFFDLGRNVFTTRESAENALKERFGKNECASENIYT